MGKGPGGELKSEVISCGVVGGDGGGVKAEDAGEDRGARLVDKCQLLMQGIEPPTRPALPSAFCSKNLAD